MQYYIWAWLIGVATMANKNTLFAMLVDHAVDGHDYDG